MLGLYLGMVLVVPYDLAISSMCHKNDPVITSQKLPHVDVDPVIKIPPASIPIQVPTMKNAEKLALFDALVAYLFKSSTAMDETVKSLATGALISPLDFQDSMASAKVLLSQV
jgi:hypothetical protein